MAPAAQRLLRLLSATEKIRRKKKERKIFIEADDHGMARSMAGGGMAP